MKNRNEKVLGFLPWKKWAERKSLQGLRQPGVYAIAKSEDDISGKRFSWLKKVIYVGMTNSQGLNDRLNQCDKAIKGKKGHGGGTRMHFKYKDYKKLVRSLYVSIYPIKCSNVDMEDKSPKDLRIMGEITKLEYVCFAIYKEKYEGLPEFNDKKRSPKK